MTPITNPLPLVTEALAALQAQTGLDARAKPTAHAGNGIIVTVKEKGKMWRYDALVRPWLTQADLGLLKAQREVRRGLRRMLVTRYTTADHAGQLRAMHLPFVDTFGNAFFDEDGLHVFVTGLGKKADAEVKPGTIIQPGALKVLFAFLCMKGFERRTHEEIRRATGVGIGTINRLLHALEHEGFLLKLKGGVRELHATKELVGTWTTAYPLRLRQKLLLGRFAAPNAGWWQDINPADHEAQWGGEVGGHCLTKHLKPQNVTLYVEKLPLDLIIKQRLRPDPRGEVEILKRFWHFQADLPRPDVVPPLLVYADLIATRDDRNIETARAISKDYLDRFIRRD